MNDGGTRAVKPVPPLEQTGRERGGIQSIERGFAILEAIAGARDGISLAELSKHLGLHTSTAFHLVQTLVALGYARQDRETRRYRIGRPLFTLAAAALDEVEMVRIVTPILEQLSAETGESGHFGAWSGGTVVVLARTPGTGAFQMASNLGLVRPAYCTALGKVLLAHLSARELDRYFAAAELRALSGRTITDPDRLRGELAQVRRTGLAYDDGEFDAEVRCVAAPVRDFTGRVSGAIGVSGPVWRLSVPALQAMTAQVAHAAGEMSRSLGNQTGG